MKKLFSLLLIIFLHTAVWADDFVPEVEEIVQTTADDFILDADDSGGDIDLQFGTALAEFLRWDNTNTRFAISDDLSLEGNQLAEVRVENLATVPTCDVANTGRIYFNTNDGLTYVCNGTVASPLENVLGTTVQFPAVQARRTTTFTLNEAFTDVDLDTTDIENATSSLDHDDINRDRINIGQTGLYQIIYGFTAGGTAAATHEARAQVRVNDTTVLPGSEAVNRNFQVEFSTTSASFLAALTAGDFITLQLNRNNVVDETQDEIFFSIVKLEGIQGEVGEQGLPGTVGLGTNEQTFTIDQDNIGVGTNVSLIAEQGADNNGEIRYNATSNEWEFSNDGGLFQSFGSGGGVSATSLAATQARLSTALTVPTVFTDVDFDQTDIENNVAVVSHDDPNTDRISVLEDGTYFVSYDFSINDPTANNGTIDVASRVRLNDTSTVNGSEGQTSSAERDAVGQELSQSFVTSLTTGDFLSLQLQGTGDTADTVANGILLVYKMEGIQGEQGLPGNDGSTESENFILDSDDTGGNLSLVFGTTNNETLLWDNANTRFDFSDDVRINGNLATSGQLFQEGNVVTLDADNAGIGTDIDIVAEQGSDNNGTLRYNATTNQWELSNDGGGFNPISTFEPSVFYGYDDAGNQAINATEVTLNIDNPVVEDPNYSLAADEVAVSDAGLYRITLDASFTEINTAGGARTSIEMRLQENGADIPGALSDCYVRESEENSCSLSILQNVAAGGVIRARLQRTGGNTNVETLADASRLVIEKIR